jgi:cytoskeletal protein CcmA (bactofilin family)
MWKKEEGKSQSVPEKSAATAGVSTAASAPSLSAPRDSSAAVPASTRGTATIGKGIRIKGEVSGNEDLFVDGSIEGKLNLSDDCCVTIGPNGEIKADIFAREVVVRGRVDGRIVGREKIQLGSTANISGDLKTERLTIEDGAILRGRVEIETGKPIEIRGEARSAVAGASGKPSISIGSGSAAN